MHLQIARVCSLASLVAPLLRFDRANNNNKTESGFLLHYTTIHPANTQHAALHTAMQCNATIHDNTLGEQFSSRGGREEVRKKHHHSTFVHQCTNSNLHRHQQQHVHCCCIVLRCWVVGWWSRWMVGRAKEVQITGRKLKWRHGWNGSDGGLTEWRT